MFEIEFLTPLEHAEDISYPGKKFSFPYMIKELSEKPDSDKADMKKVIISVPHVILRRWHYTTSFDLYKILFTYVKTHIEEKLNRRSLQEKESLELDLRNHGNDNPSPGKIPNFLGMVFRIK
jgi:hypothetical protein